MLRNIERLTQQKIAVESLPTVADLRARRLELTRASVREVILEGDLDRFRVVLESLSDEFDLVDIALGAVKMAHEAATGGIEGEEEDIPIVKPTAGAAKAKGGKRKGGGSDDRSDAGGRAGRRTRNLVGTKVFIGAGRAAGVRPKDLVGAITGEAGISGDEIGAIQISDRFSLVEVADDVVDDVVRALRATKVKGKKVKVRAEGRADA